jgi:ureidoglycolate hydrolase
MPDYHDLACVDLAGHGAKGTDQHTFARNRASSRCSDVAELHPLGSQTFCRWRHYLVWC